MSALVRKKANFFWQVLKTTPQSAFNLDKTIQFFTVKFQNIVLNEKQTVQTIIRR
jgi:hypothetical protein